MADPWDIPPLPLRGDDDADDTYKMVGRALTEWEELEYILSHLHAQFIGKPAQISAMRRYGEPRIFIDRAKALKTAADAFFTGRPNQQAEGELQSLLSRIGRFAERRNEIAHGVVRPLQWIHPPLPEYDGIKGDVLRYALVPPLYTSRKLDEKHRPKYIYTASELERFALAFHDLAGEVVHLRLVTAREPRSSPPTHRTPSRGRYRA